MNFHRLTTSRIDAHCRQSCIDRLRGRWRRGFEYRTSGAGPTAPPATTAATTPGVWKGSIVSTTTGQTSSVVALTGA